MMDLLNQLIKYEEKKLERKKGNVFHPVLDLHNHIWICGPKKEAFYFIKDDESKPLRSQLPFFLFPEQVYELIYSLEIEEKKEIDSFLEKTPGISLCDKLVLWRFRHLDEGNILSNKLTKEYQFLLKKWEDPDFQLYSTRYKELLDKSFFEFLNDNQDLLVIPQIIDDALSWHIVTHAITWYLRTVFEKQTFAETITAEDVFLLLFKDELGIGSFKEIESIESAICYLIYKTNWFYKYKERNKQNMAIASVYDRYTKTSDGFFGNYLAVNNGFDGEFWASYDEFIHDEWLDDNLPETFVQNERSLYHKELYTKLRNQVSMKKGKR